MNISGRSLELYFIDGKPDGMLTAEVFNWTGHILMTPRTQLKEALKRKEVSYTGVYLLMGEIDSEASLYIGEAENISERIRNHDSKKDWWDTAIFVTSSANNLHKAHVKYLEARLVEKAKQIGRVKPDNKNDPQKSSLSEPAATNMEAFLEHLMMVLPALRIDIFLDKTSSSNNTGYREDFGINPVFATESKKLGVSAHAILNGSDFIVQAGSIARNEWIGDPAANTSYSKLYYELIETGILAKDGEMRVFTKNFAFSSTSAAGAIIYGRSTRGPTLWKLQSDGRTYQQWEQDQLDVTD